VNFRYDPRLDPRHRLTILACRVGAGLHPVAGAAEIVFCAAKVGLLPPGNVWRVALPGSAAPFRPPGCNETPSQGQDRETTTVVSSASLNPADFQARYATQCEEQGEHLVITTTCELYRGQDLAGSGETVDSMSHSSCASLSVGLTTRSAARVGPLSVSSRYSGNWRTSRRWAVSNTRKRPCI
jgi:hypothetical protein